MNLDLKNQTSIPPDLCTEKEVSSTFLCNEDDFENLVEVFQLLSTWKKEELKKQPKQSLSNHRRDNFCDTL
jgi:hypothetical protein